jgi:hypothetical protein
MAGHRFEIGECVTYLEKRFPNTVRYTELVVIERLTGAGEPHYQLRGSDGQSLYVLPERRLSPNGSLEASRPRKAPDLAPIARDRGGSPWAA